MQKEKLIKDVDKKLQFTLMLALFFPVLLEALFSFSGSDSAEISKNVMKWSLVVFFLILSYLLFEWRKKKLNSKSLKYLNWTFVSAIICYSMIIMHIGMTTSNNQEFLNYGTAFIFSFALFGTIAAPCITIFIILSDLLYTAFTASPRQTKKVKV